MNRIEIVREVIDKHLLKITDDEERRCAYVHLYGVAQACALIAKKCKGNVELAVIAGMLHDVYSYVNMDSKDHAYKGAETAKDILTSLDIFTEEEKELICTAIYNHSDKAIVHSSLDEVLKDADVMQHVLYNPLVEVKEHEKDRFDILKKEFNLGK